LERLYIRKIHILKGLGNCERFYNKNLIKMAYLNNTVNFILDVSLMVIVSNAKLALLTADVFISDSLKMVPDKGRNIRQQLNKANINKTFGWFIVIAFVVLKARSAGVKTNVLVLSSGTY
jgi:hypothetical protein